MGMAADGRFCGRRRERRQGQGPGSHNHRLDDPSATSREPMPDRNCSPASLTAALLACALLAPPAAHAASEEIQVYLDDLSAPGQFGVDVHNNLVLKGERTPAYPGATPPHHQYRLTPEFYYGITPTLELGLYLLGSRSAEGLSQGQGAKLRLKYVAAHDQASGGFWGLNLEIGKTTPGASPTPWNGQLKAILGWRSGPWTFGANPNLDWSLSKGGEPAAASLDLKVARQLAERTQLGAELYSDLGPARGVQAWRRNAKTFYLVLDQELGADIDLNLGLGRGLTPDADRWTLKFIVGTHF
jgi:hypothetical protein